MRYYLTVLFSNGTRIERTFAAVDDMYYYKQKLMTQYKQLASITEEYY